MAQNIILDNNNNLVDSVNVFENRINSMAHLFYDTYHIIDTTNGEIDHLDISYEIIQEENQNDQVTLVARDQYDNSLSEKISVKELTQAFHNSYLSGKFVKQGIYQILKKIGYRICDQKNHNKRILKDFLAHSNSIVYKNDIPVLVVSEIEDDKYFYELSKKNSDDEEVSIVMNFFNTDSFSSIYQNPINELLNISQDGVSVETVIEEGKRCSYKIVNYNKELDNIFIFNLELTNGQIFKLINVEIVNDFLNTKNMLNTNYNNRSKILDKLLCYSISSHTEDLFDLID